MQRPNASRLSFTLSRSITGLQSCFSGIWFALTHQDVRAEYFRCWKYIAVFTLSTILLSQLLIFPLSFVFVLLDLITFDLFDLTKYSDALGESLARLILDVVPALCIPLIGFPLEHAFFRVLRGASATACEELEAMPRQPWSLMAFLRSTVGYAGKALGFSVLLLALSLLPVRGLWALAFAVVKIALIAPFTGTGVAVGGVVFGYFFPSWQPVVMRALNLWRQSHFVAEYLLEPYIRRHFSNAATDRKKCTNLLVNNQDVLLPFAFAYMLLSNVPIVGPLVFLFSVPASAMLVPHIAAGKKSTV
eukprot:GDKI01024346.1.p1 GENE.GDKI01024346.1~~GDKI01024346.1.p1  ORF type:complete len:304 (+),score=72.45 GDKI01024346.1:90-1001(+)